MFESHHRRCALVICDQPDGTPPWSRRRMRRALDENPPLPLRVAVVQRGLVDVVGDLREQIPPIGQLPPKLVLGHPDRVSRAVRSLKTGCKVS
jgi:hypothetical protein